MPSLADMLVPAQIANVTGYIRTHFGNNYPAPVTAEDVQRPGAKPL
jgi:mono/diheme cytochrome c family protein